MKCAGLPHCFTFEKINRHMYQTLLVETNNHICTITINRPDKMNALNRTVMEELSKAVEEVYSNDDIRSAIITGAGAKAFVAGADIAEFVGLSREEGMQLAKMGQDIFFKIENSHKPFVAAVNGFALGGGCELAMSCHFRIAAENAKFGQPEVNLGLIPGYGGTQRLTYLIGKGRAMELLMSAALIDANTAHQYGLVNHVVPQEELMNKTISILDTINSKAPIAIGKCIECANVAVISDSAYTNGKSGFEKEIEAFGDCFATEDMKEGTSAFLEKRKASFSGK
jgi:enoyl-CoA hydratase